MARIKCDVCDNTAVYAIDEGDGNYCSYACGVCIRAWWNPKVTILKIEGKSD